MKIIALGKSHVIEREVENLKNIADCITKIIDPQNKELLYKEITDADIIMNSSFYIDKNLLEKAKNLKMILMMSVGFDKVDLQETKKRNIIVCNCPGYNAEAVAEHTIFLLLDAVRFGSFRDRELRKGSWLPNTFMSREMKGRTLGVIGYGTIGKRVAEIAQDGLKMNILTVNSSSTRAEFEFLLKNSDFISVNTPLNEKTKGMIGEKEFDLMKQGVVLVNTGRGAVINEDALLKNLASRKVFACGLDTFTQEPISKDHPLFKFENVVLTPHSAWNSEESDTRLSSMIKENIEHFIKGTPKNIVS